MLAPTAAPPRPAAQEIKAAGSDFTIIAQSADGTRAWRFGARMTVQVSCTRWIGSILHPPGCLQQAWVLHAQ